MEPGSATMMRNSTTNVPKVKSDLSMPPKLHLLFFFYLIDKFFSVPWKRQQIRYAAELLRHSRRRRIGLVVQPNKFSGTIRSKTDLLWRISIFVAAGFWSLMSSHLIQSRGSHCMCQMTLQASVH